MISLTQPAQTLKPLFQTLRNDFQKAADVQTELRHVIIQALDEEGSVPPRMNKAMKAAGGSNVGEIRQRWDADDRDRALFRMDMPAKIGYLYGAKAARRCFERLAERGWLALPGSQQGKLEHFPQERLVDRWLDFIYGTLDRLGQNFFEPNDELWACWKSGNGRDFLEKAFTCRRVQQGHIVEWRYPDADGLPDLAQRRRITRLATDPFTASAAAIELLLADPQYSRLYLISSQELDSYQASAEFQNADFLVDEIRLGEGRRFPILRSWCRPSPGSIPTICPKADPPGDCPDRAALLRYMPRIAARFRELGLIGADQTIHWVGRQTKLSTLCQCPLQGETATPTVSKRRGGRLRFEKSKPLTVQVYTHIHREHRPKAFYVDTVERLKKNKDFVEQVRTCGLALNSKLVRTALAYFYQRDVAARKKPA